MSLIPTQKKAPPVLVMASMNVVAEFSTTPETETSTSKTLEQLEQKPAQSVMSSGAKISVSTCGKGLPDEVSIVLANGRSILVNSSKVRIMSMISGGFSVITPKATVIYDSGGNELSVIPGAVPPADAVLGSIIFSTETADYVNSEPDTSVLAEAPEPNFAIQAQRANILTSKTTAFPSALFGLP